MMRRTIAVCLAASAVLCLSGCVTATYEYGQDHQLHEVSDVMDPQTAAKRRVNIAIGHMNKGQMTEAKKNLEIAKKYDSDSPYVKLSYADYYQRVGEDQHAEELYRELVSRNPENIGDVYNSYANFLCSKDRFTEAYETFGKAVKIPSYANISGVYVNASACAHHQKNYSLSLAYIDKAIDYDGASPELFAIKAQLALDAGDMPTAKTAIAVFDRMAKGKESPRSYLDKIKIADSEHNINESMRLGKELVEKYPNSSQAREYMNNEY